MSPKRREGKRGRVASEGSHIVRRRTLRSSTEEDSSDRAGENEITDLCHHGDRSEARVYRLAENALLLSFLDGSSKPFEKSGGKRPDRGFSVRRLPIDELPGHEEGEVRIRREHRYLTFHDRADY